MGETIIEKILRFHSPEKHIKPEQIIDIEIDARIARDFGGANVVGNLETNHLSIADTEKTFFTFDCNPGGSDQKYAANQQRCRMFARSGGIKVFDVDAGIGTHIAIDRGLVHPGGTLISTDSHANILGAIGAFGQGMGDQDIAASFARGKIWFRVPRSLKIFLKGKPSSGATAKDIGLKLLQHFGANGLLGFSAEIYGNIVDEMSLSDRITIASLGTEMGAILLLFSPNKEVISYLRKRSAGDFEPVYADNDACYEKTEEIDIEGLEPLLSRPGSPSDVTLVSELPKTKIDSAFIGSCTNGRFEDFREASRILRGKTIAPGVVLKMVPATREIYLHLLDEGIIQILSKAGCLIGNPGCAGCAAGQIGQNGPGEVTVSTGNRNFPGKQGKGSVYLSSPRTAAASALAGFITTAENIPEKPAIFVRRAQNQINTPGGSPQKPKRKPLTTASGRVWVIDIDNIDTDMIFHNRYLAITNIKEMGKYAFDNLMGYEDFAKKAEPGDIIITAGNFGCGSSRGQAVDCFRAIGINAICANSFGAIYERNAINAAFPILTFEEKLSLLPIKNGDMVSINFETGELTDPKGRTLLTCRPFSKVQMEIFKRGGLLEI